MPKWGYALVLALTAVLAGYVSWPSGTPTQIAAFPQPLPATFTVTGELGDQVVTAGKIRVAGLERTAETRSIAALRSHVDHLTVPPTQVLEEIDANVVLVSQLADSHRIHPQPVEIRQETVNAGFHLGLSHGR